jgi:hypothetical protein
MAHYSIVIPGSGVERGMSTLADVRERARRVLKPGLYSVIRTSGTSLENREAVEWGCVKVSTNHATNTFKGRFVGEEA